MKLLITLFIFASSLSSFGQLPYTSNTNSFTVDSNIVYGTGTNYAGIEEDLMMDIYKPVNANCSRPCLILVHGGAWMAGSKTDPSIVNIARDFAEKGWVVATINYRLGMHKRANYTQYWACTNELAQPCSYMADSSEVIRAIFRAQQDVKGAIRGMKMRSEIDSTDVTNFFVAGESAGGFNALTATFLNEPNEKFPQAFSIADAPVPDADLTSCLPTGYSLSRPDLGTIDGTLNLGRHDASVQGVGNFYGGVLNLELFQNETNWPEMYFFHQGSDVIVHYNYGKLLGRLDWECFAQSNICQTYAVAPFAYGSKGIVNYFNNLPAPPTYVSTIIENYDYLNNCFSNGHAIDNWITRSQEMADLFALRIQANGNDGTATNCILNTNIPNINHVTISPNPSNGLVIIQGESNIDYQASLLTFSGQVVSNFTFKGMKQMKIEKGVYLLQLTSPTGSTVQRIIVE